MAEIKYKGKTLRTDHNLPITDEQMVKFKDEYYKKPSIEEVKANMKKLSGGQVMNTAITKYYFFDLMAKTQLSNAKWTVEDIFKHKPLLEYFYSKSKGNKNVFNSDDEVKNIATAIRLGGKGVAKLPTKFPVKVAYEFLKDYMPEDNNNYYDYSCGWGDRLSAAMKSNVNYFGTDPNHTLVERLIDMGDLWKETVGLKNTIDIRSQGSEIFIPEWENTMGVAFSSPPYYDLEDYKIGDQSYKEGVTYKEWVDNYFKPTIENSYKYLVDGGIFAINIKEYSHAPMVTDAKRIAEDLGMELIEIADMKNIKRTKSNGEFLDNSEGIYIFKK